MGGTGPGDCCLINCAGIGGVTTGGVFGTEGVSSIRSRRDNNSSILRDSASISTLPAGTLPDFSASFNPSTEAFSNLAPQ